MSTKANLRHLQLLGHLTFAMFTVIIIIVLIQCILINLQQSWHCIHQQQHPRSLLVVLKQPLTSTE